MIQDQSEDTEVVNAVCAAMREADRVFEKVGGSTRHHVRDCLLPVLNRNGWRVVAASPADGVECGWCEGKGWLASDDPAFTLGVDGGSVEIPADLHARKHE